MLLNNKGTLIFAVHAQQILQPLKHGVAADMVGVQNKPFRRLGRAAVKYIYLGIAVFVLFNQYGAGNDVKRQKHFLSYYGFRGLHIAFQYICSPGMGKDISVIQRYFAFSISSRKYSSSL